MPLIDDLEHDVDDGDAGAPTTLSAEQLQCGARPVTMPVPGTPDNAVVLKDGPTTSVGILFVQNIGDCTVFRMVAAHNPRARGSILAIISTPGNHHPGPMQSWPQRPQLPWVAPRSRTTRAPGSPERDPLAGQADDVPVPGVASVGDGQAVGLRGADHALRRVEGRIVTLRHRSA